MTSSPTPTLRTSAIPQVQDKARELSDQPTPPLNNQVGVGAIAKEGHHNLVTPSHFDMGETSVATAEEDSEDYSHRLTFLTLTGG